MRIILVLIMLLAAGQAAAARKTISKSYEATWHPPEQHDVEAFQYTGAMRFDGKFKIWYLLGEPVVNCTARWNNPEQGTTAVPVGDRRVLEAPQKGEVEVYNLVLAATASDPRGGKYGAGSGRQLAVLCDAGVVAQSGRNGFNVAGSPDWDKFICALPGLSTGRIYTQGDLCEQMRGEWLDAANAKAIAAEGIDHKTMTFNVISAEVSGAAVLKRVEKRAWREKSAAFKRQRTAALLDRIASRSSGFEAANRQISLLNSLPYLPETPSSEELDAYEVAYQSALARLESDESHADEWREKERALVREQLEKVRAAEKRVAAEERAVADYRRDLEKRLEDLERQGLYGALGVALAQDDATGLWGYRFGDEKKWLIEPKFLWAEKFNEDGLAEVTIKDEFIRNETVTFTRRTCGRDSTVTEQIEIRKKESGTINYKGAFVEGPTTSEYKQGGSVPGIVLCRN
ncbi:MAG: hypothetical protein RIC52_04085 [Amphiplicatus sp.]